MHKTGKESWRDNRETPRWLVRWLESINRQPYTIDLFASEHNRVCERWQGPDCGIDTLDSYWRGPGIGFANPPFSIKRDENFCEWWEGSYSVDLILPSAPFERWWVSLCAHSGSVFHLVGYRPKFKPGPDAPEGARWDRPSGNVTIFRSCATRPALGCGECLYVDGKQIWIDASAAYRNHKGEDE